MPFHFSMSVELIPSRTSLLSCVCAFDFRVLISSLITSSVLTRSFIRSDKSLSALDRFVTSSFSAALLESAAERASTALSYAIFTACGVAATDSELLKVSLTLSDKVTCPKTLPVAFVFECVVRSLRKFLQDSVFDSVSWFTASIESCNAVRTSLPYIADFILFNQSDIFAMVIPPRLLASNQALVFPHRLRCL